MKLSRIYIQSFGAIKNQWLPVDNNNYFSPGLNIAYGPNEAGKSQIRDFIEEMLFPELTSRRKVKSQILGKLYFLHEDKAYELETLQIGKSISHLLNSSANGPASIADLFPGLSLEGHAVFSNLYSFGLDQLLQSTTAGNRSLSEHLFGAIASGRGISISSVVDNLESQLKKSIGGRSKGRTLEVIFDELTNLKRECDAKVEEQTQFAQRLFEREETSGHLVELGNELKKLDYEINFIKLVQSKYQEYQSYIEAKAFFDNHVNLDQFDDEIATALSRSFRKQAELESQISELKENIDGLGRDREAYQASLTNISPAVVEVANSKVLELLNLDLAISELDREYLSKSRELERYSRSVPEMSKDRLANNNLNKVSLAREIEKVGDLRNDVRDWQKKASSLRGLDYQVDLSQLHSKKLELSKSIELIKVLLRDSSTSAAQPHSRINIILSLVFMLLFIGSIVTLAAGIRGIYIFITAAGSLMLLGLFIGRATSNRRGSTPAELDDTVKARFQSFGIDLSDRMRLADSIGLLQAMEVEVSDQLKVLDCLGKLNAEAANYGIDGHPQSDHDALVEQLSSLMEYLRLLDQLNDIRSNQERRYSDRDGLIDKIVALIEPLDGGVSSAAPYSVDSINVSVKEFQRMIEQDKVVQTHISSLDARIESEAHKLHQKIREYDDNSSYIRDLLTNTGVEERDLDDELFETLDRFLEFKKEIENFTKSIVNLFRGQSDKAYFEFEKGEIELANLVDELENQRSEVKTNIEELVKLRANIEIQETRFFNENPISELQNKYESAKLEAEEMIRTLKPIALAKELLVKANKTFEEVHQPELLRLSSEIFSRITEGRYVAIVKKEELGHDRIYARNRVGEDILDVNLSRGTREQLYIAIRLALVSRIDSLDLPLLMDDVMVNSDSKRSCGLAKELQEVAKYRQIIYFCARQETIDIFRSAGVRDFSLYELQRLP